MDGAPSGTADSPLGGTDRKARTKAEGKARTGLGLWFPTFDAMRLRQGWGTQFFVEYAAEFIGCECVSERIGHG